MTRLQDVRREGGEHLNDTTRLGKTAIRQRALASARVTKSSKDLRQLTHGRSGQLPLSRVCWMFCDLTVLTCNSTFLLECSMLWDLFPRCSVLSW